MKIVKTKRDYRIGDEVFAKFPEDCLMYLGTVLKRNTDGTFQVRWENVDGGPEESVVSANDMKVPPIPYDKLKVGQVYTGTVTRVEEVGAFVGVGANREGLLHVSDIFMGRVDDIHTLLEEDQEVKVWTCALDDDSKFRLTMIMGRRYGQGGRRFTNLSALAWEIGDEWLDGEVVRVVPCGAFVDVKVDGVEQVRGFVHVSHMSETFVEDISSVVEVGKVVRLRLVDVRGKGEKLSFSMRSSVVPNPALKTKVAPDFGTFLKIAPSTWLKGRVNWLSPKGAFIELTEPGGHRAYL
ncbi:unnamed protein product [Prorocentrum cordatum]|uniref:S1 motif domain-containing protein n=1 Tax=Prorocentrum cordatum TaxID=2364126 RepID=A0ABN9W1S3_9DINO|nr:unnamed protein product [Polarella glacialis]